MEGLQRFRQKERKPKSIIVFTFAEEALWIYIGDIR